VLGGEDPTEENANGPVYGPACPRRTCIVIASGAYRAGSSAAAPYTEATPSRVRHESTLLDRRRDDGGCSPRAAPGHREWHAVVTGEMEAALSRKYAPGQQVRKRTRTQEAQPMVGACRMPLEGRM
jgi:hypothetical protein